MTEVFKMLNANSRMIKQVLTLLSIVVFFEASVLKFLPFIYAVSFCFIAVLFLCVGKKFTINISFVLWYITSLFFVFSIFYSSYQKVSLVYSIQFFIIISLAYCLSLLKGWKDYLLYIFSLMVSVVVVSVYLSYLFPTIYDYVILQRFSILDRIFVTNLINGKSHSGIYINTGYTAFFLSIGLSIAYSKLLFSQKNKKNIIIFVLILIAILLTGKRSFLISNSCSLLFVTYIYYIHSKNKFGIRIISLFLVLVVGLYLVVPDIISSFFNRFQTESGSYTLKTLSQGRYELYNYGLSLFKESPLLGKGIESASYELLNNNFTSILMGVHNIYLKLLAEVGILGTLIFLFAAIVSFIRTCKLFYRCLELKATYSKQVAFSLYLQILFYIYGFFGNVLSDMNMLLTYFIGVAVSENIYRYQRELEGGNNKNE